MIPYDPSEDDSLFLDYAAGMLEVLPYSAATITLYLDALASVLAQSTCSLLDELLSVRPCNSCSTRYTDQSRKD